VSKPTTFATGRRAEEVAAQYLLNREYAIVAQNWRTRYCEIDIVARRHHTVYFVEVKYRRSGRQGQGLDYITATKLQRMQFAAQLWVVKNCWAGDYNLAALEVSGPNFEVTNYLASI
jgi:uncharacterized protein (TIGR00252 family)